MNFRRIAQGQRLKQFWQREDGAITVDWVVLTAAVCGMALSIWFVLVDELFVDGGIAIAEDIEEAARRDF